MKNKFNGKGKETLFHEKEKKSGLFLYSLVKKSQFCNYYVV